MTAKHLRSKFRQPRVQLIHSFSLGVIVQVSSKIFRCKSVFSSPCFALFYFLSCMCFLYCFLLPFTLSQSLSFAVYALVLTQNSSYDTVRQTITIVIGILIIPNHTGAPYQRTSTTYSPTIVFFLFSPLQFRIILFRVAIFGYIFYSDLLITMLPIETYNPRYLRGVQGSSFLKNTITDGQ